MTAAKPPKQPATRKTTRSEKVVRPGVYEAPVAPKKTGKYTPELITEIFHRISTGESLLKICRDDHMPSRRAIYQWIERDDSLAAQFAHAREAGCDAMAEDSLAIMDGEPLAVFDEAGNKRYDPGSISWNKSRAEHRLKLMACWNPKKYGTKVQMGGDPGNPIKIEAQVEADNFLAAIMKNAELKRQVSANE